MSPETDRRATDARLQTLAYELTVAEARERRRIAHLLHDEVGQLLAMAQLRLGDLARDPTPAALDDLGTLLREASAATRAATFELHSPVLQQLGLQAALESHLQRLARGSALRAHLQATAPEPPLDDVERSVLLRVVRELTLNTLKHARATQLWVELAVDDEGLHVTVRDDGAGFEVDAVDRRFSPEGGFGLLSAEAQMQAVGGRLVIESAPGAGTRALLTLPLPGLGAAGLPTAPRRAMPDVHFP